MEKNKQSDNAEALGLHTKQRFDSKMGAQTGNDKGNQNPAGNPVGPKPAKM